jgi:hypothetical protein
MEVKKLENLALYQTASLYTNLFNKAVSEAKEEIRKNGLPIVFNLNGKIYYELPNGEITTESPFEKILSK